MTGTEDFTSFSREAVEHLTSLMEESNLSVGGHVLFAHYQQGMTDYLAIALLNQSDSVTVTDTLDVTPSRHLDLSKLHLAARINLSEWQNNKQSKQYISFIKGKNGRKATDYFSDLSFTFLVGSCYMPVILASIARPVISQVPSSGTVLYSGFRGTK